MITDLLKDSDTYEKEHLAKSTARPSPKMDVHTIFGDMRRWYEGNVFNHSDYKIDKAKYEMLKAYYDEKEKASAWIPVKWHSITDDERKNCEIPDFVDAWIESPLPNDGERILVYTKSGDIKIDKCEDDLGGVSLESGYDWINDVVAWLPLPKPYTKEIGGNDDGE